ncbi:hypothetical protein K474DRAFT_1709222 [Panus rudis PR-1116 ss-1]|nr:hypothetical protein K474DRAFT_1709222 [Panus rudis PR-1116 ss-1]
MTSYDQSLLASAPVATRAEKQASGCEGYNVDLLTNARDVSKSNCSSPTPRALAPSVDNAESGRTKEAYGVVYPSRTTSWYKTRKWIAIFTIIAIACVAAIIGGAVGGTLSHKHKSNSSAISDDGGSTQPISGPDQDSQGGVAGSNGPASSSSGSNSTTAAPASAPTATTTSASNPSESISPDSGNGSVTGAGGGTSTGTDGVGST